MYCAFFSQKRDGEGDLEKYVMKNFSRQGEEIGINSELKKQYCEIVPNCQKHNTGLRYIASVS